MEVYTDKRIKKILNNFSTIEKARIEKVVSLFEEKEFRLSEIYLKKLSKNIWELRPGNIRLLFGVIESQAVIVNVFIKQTAKTPKHEIELAERRLSDYI